MLQPNLSLSAWAKAHETDLGVAEAILTLADSEADAERIWHAPTSYELTAIQKRLQHYVPTTQGTSPQWGQGTTLDGMIGMHEGNATRARTLALLLLKWEEHREQLDALETDIQGIVLSLKRTQVVGNVRATYSAGRKRYDYETALRGHDITDDSMQAHTTITTTVDWRALCKHLEIAQGTIPCEQSAPSVTIKKIT